MRIYVHRKNAPVCWAQRITARLGELQQMSKSTQPAAGKPSKAFPSDFANVIEANAAELQKLHDDVHRTWKLRKIQKASWHEAAERFRNSYDRLAFPGGLQKATALLAKNDPAIIETGVSFLEADPWFFRSGYIKADLLQRFRRAPLTEDQKTRLQKVIMDRIYGEDRREFKYYCRIARFISNPNFEQAVTELESSPVEHVSRHARWVLDQLRAASKSR